MYHSLLTVQLTKIKGGFRQILVICILNGISALEPVKIHYFKKMDNWSIISHMILRYIQGSKKKRIPS